MNDGKPAIARWMKPPRIVVQRPSPEWTEIKGDEELPREELSNIGMKKLKAAIKNQEPGGGGVLKVGDNLRYEFTAEQFVIRDSWSGNESSRPHHVVGERRSYKTHGGRDVLNCDRNRTQLMTKYLGDREVSVVMQRKQQSRAAAPSLREPQRKQQSCAVAPSPREPQRKDKAVLGKATSSFSSSSRKISPQGKVAAHSKTAASAKQSPGHISRTDQCSSRTISSFDTKPKAKLSNKTVSSSSHGSHDTTGTSTKQAKAIAIFSETKKPSNRILGEPVTKQAGPQAGLATSRLGHKQAAKGRTTFDCKDVLFAAKPRSKSMTKVDSVLQTTNSTDKNVLCHSACNLFPVTMEQLYEEVEALQPPRPSIARPPNSTEELSTAGRKSSVGNRSVSGLSSKDMERRPRASTFVCAPPPQEEGTAEIVLPQITMDEVLKSWHVSHPRRTRSSSTGKSPHDVLQFLMKSPEATEESSAERHARTETEYEKLKRCRYLRLGREQEELVKHGATCSCNSCEHATGLKATPFLNS